VWVDPRDGGSTGAATLEWLEADGLGGFASGTASQVRTRRYHGLLAPALTPPTGRVMLVADLEVELDLGHGPRALSAHRYLPDVTHPDGLARLVGFDPEPSPTWTFEVDGVRVEQRLAVPRGKPAVALEWRLARPVPGARLRVRPLLAARDLHGLQHQRGDACMEAEVRGTTVRWTPLAGWPTVVAFSAGSYHHEPLWYRDFLYEEERARGYDHREDLASPGALVLALEDGTAGLVLAAEARGLPPIDEGDLPVTRLAADLVARERARRARIPSRLDRAAEAYLVRRGEGLSLVAGYPWFTDWGRDTFIALRGLCLARGRLDDAESILRAWAGAVSEGMLPNRFVEGGEAPEYNSVDASLWFVVAVGEYLDARAAAGERVSASERHELTRAVEAILGGYAGGTRYGIRMDRDGLLAAGETGWQLTWMDARVDGHVVTPRIGKPVEVQALWASALAVGARLDGRWGEPLASLRTSFAARFWSVERGHLADVVDVDHVPGTVDMTLRPNQVLAVGGLPVALLDGDRARSVVDVLEERLWTPLGLRTLPADHPDHHGVYAGGPAERDRAYHQGTAWPWLLGPFVEAWVRVRGNTTAARAEARERFVAPLLAHLDDAGLGHVSEIADGDAPHCPRGCPFQAWSLGELMRLERVVLAPERPRKAPRSPRSTAGRTG